MAPRKTTTYGFARAEKLLSGQIRKASESRGFAESRVLTHWAEIVGADLAAVTRPVEVKYGRVRMDGKVHNEYGGKLVVLTKGSFAPILEMRKAEIVEKINAVYGYCAVRHVIVTQTAPTGFSEGQVSFDHRPAKQHERAPKQEAVTEARTLSEGVADEGLRAALERLGANVISKTGQTRTRSAD
ncbi:DUF721 domain-containing protein [Sagittula salina]|uniref:DUF721 domain-containing protein n=1 Tax=Sagittula salina TaxID=2820268 RepID=A0A940S334_9RHOB|nr:DciA family protein [Sagittula salina]MBP0482330.1 DUF721 domain-containing protein [Sagittula salina]